MCVAVEWSCLQDFSLLAGDVLLDNVQSLKCTISGLTTVTVLRRGNGVLYLAAFLCNLRDIPVSVGASATSYRLFHQTTFRVSPYI